MVAPAQLLDDEASGILYRGVVGGVGHHADSADAVRLMERGGERHDRRVAVDHRHRAAFRREGVRDCRADAAGRPQHRHHVAPQASVHGWGLYAAAATVGAGGRRGVRRRAAR